MRPAGLLIAGLLAGCAQHPLPSQPAAVTVERAPEVRRLCPPVPEHVRAVAARRIDLPLSDADRTRLAGDAVLADLAKGRALAEMIAIYDRCRVASETPK